MMTRSRTAAAKGVQSPCLPQENLDKDQQQELDPDDPEKLIPAYTNQQLKDWQAKDLDIRRVIQLKLKSGDRPRADRVKQESAGVRTMLTMWNEYELRNGLLVRLKSVESQIEPLVQ